MARAGVSITGWDSAGLGLGYSHDPLPACHCVRYHFLRQRHAGSRSQLFPEPQSCAITTCAVILAPALPTHPTPGCHSLTTRSPSHPPSRAHSARAGPGPLSMETPGPRSLGSDSKGPGPGTEPLSSFDPAHNSPLKLPKWLSTPNNYPPLCWRNRH